MRVNLLTFIFIISLSYPQRNYANSCDSIFKTLYKGLSLRLKNRLGILPLKTRSKNIATDHYDRALYLLSQKNGYEYLGLQFLNSKGEVLFNTPPITSRRYDFVSGSSEYLLKNLISYPFDISKVKEIKIIHTHPEYDARFSPADIRAAYSSRALINKIPFISNVQLSEDVVWSPETKKTFSLVPDLFAFNLRLSSSQQELIDIGEQVHTLNSKFLSFLETNPSTIKPYQYQNSSLKTPALLVQSSYNKRVQNQFSLEFLASIGNESKTSQYNLSSLDQVQDRNLIDSFVTEVETISRNKKEIKLYFGYEQGVLASVLENMRSILSSLQKRLPYSSFKVYLSNITLIRSQEIIEMSPNHFDNF